jgi:hypothetical protein
MVRFTLATMVTTALLVVAGVPSVYAGSAADPEILDARQDVNPAAFASSVGADNQSIFDNATAYDVVKGWVAAESATHFLIFIKVDDLPDDWGPAGPPPSQSPFGVNASFSGTSLVANFSVAGKMYWAIAKLAYLGKSGGLVDNYTLWRDGAEWRELSGSYSVSSDLIQMRLPKAAFLGLADSVRLEKFWIQGRFGDHAMDFAPNAKDPAQPSITSPPDPLVLSQMVASGKIVAPQYGRDYVFGQYYHPPSGGGNGGGSAPDLVMRIEGSDGMTIKAGEKAQYLVLIENRAGALDTVYFTLSSASSGWEHRFEVQSLVLQSGESKLLALDVTAGEGVRGTMRSVVDASSQLGAARSVSVLTLIDESDVYQPPPSDTQIPVLPAPSEGGGSPGVAAVAIFAALAVVALFIRRGTR